MNLKETRETLIDTRKMVRAMDQNHAQRLLNILLNARDNKPCAFFLHMDVKKCVKQILSGLINSGQANTLLSCKQMKKIYTVLGDYGLSPVCRLCGKPIQIDSSTAPDRPGAFSWDHVVPRAFGGEYELYNTEPAHRDCNSRRGCNPFVAKNNINIVININNCDNCDCVDCEQRQYRPLSAKDFICIKIRENSK